MKELGYSASIDSVGNCIGRLGKGDPTILLCGHMDTVTPELPVYLNDNTIFGRGSVDAKSSLAALIIGGKLAFEDGFPGTLIVVGTVCEEGDNRGVKALIKSGLKANYAVFGEPTDTYSLGVGYRGCLVCEIVVYNESGHSSAPWAFPNAVEKAFNLYQQLKNSTGEISSAPQGFESLSVSIRKIEGGENEGVIPKRCIMTIELRIPPQVNCLQVKKWLRKKTSMFLSENSKEKIKCRIIDEVDPFITDKKSVLVKVFSQTIFKTCGSVVKLLKKTGTSDMNYYGIANGVPIITYGPGSSQLSHTQLECISLDDYMISIDIIKKSLIKLAS